jgi:hypothetical protein
VAAAGAAAIVWLLMFRRGGQRGEPVPDELGEVGNELYT